MNNNDLVQVLQDYKNFCDKQIIIMTRSAKMTILFYYTIMLFYIISSSIAALLSASNIGVISNGSERAAYSLNIIVLVAVLISMVLSGINTIISPSNKSQNCCITFKLYYELSRELYIKIENYKTAVDDGTDRSNEYQDLLLFYSSRIQTIQVNQPLAYFSKISYPLFNHNKVEEV